MISHNSPVPHQMQCFTTTDPVWEAHSTSDYTCCVFTKDKRHFYTNKTQTTKSWPSNFDPHFADNSAHTMYICLMTQCCICAFRARSSPENICLMSWLISKWTKCYICWCALRDKSHTCQLFQYLLMLCVYVASATLKGLPFVSLKVKAKIHIHNGDRNL